MRPCSRRSPKPTAREPAASGLAPAVGQAFSRLIEEAAHGELSAVGLRSRDRVMDSDMLVDDPGRAQTGPLARDAEGHLHAGGDGPGEALQDLDEGHIAG